MKETIHSSTNIYKIVEILGEGSSGTVYKAEKSDNAGDISTIVALKVLNSDEMIEAWKREFQSLKQVRSHYCVHVYGFERVMERPALSLEYVEGLSLQELIGYGVVNSNLILEIGHQILLGLKDLWKEGLQHGDLSPANVLISTSGQVKLLDFGLGNKMGAIRMGTPQFMAPEVLDGNEIENEKSDLYSLGRILDYLSIGENSSKDLSEIIYNLTKTDLNLREANFPKGTESSKVELAQFVREAYRQKRFQQTETQEFIVKSVAIPIENKLTQKGSPKFLMLAVLLIVGALISSTFVWRHLYHKPGQMRIRSQSWYKLKIDGKDQGYTPLDLVDLSPGKYTIEWEGPSGSGKRVLTLESGENKVINDAFFQNQPEE